MARKSKIFEAIKLAVVSGELNEPFTVAKVNKACSDILSKSHSFLSKHRADNPGNNNVYFIRISTGAYKTIT